jgi:hypothetical protein
MGLRRAKTDDAEEFRRVELIPVARCPWRAGLAVELIGDPAFAFLQLRAVPRARGPVVKRHADCACSPVHVDSTDTTSLWPERGTLTDQQTVVARLLGMTVRGGRVRASVAGWATVQAVVGLIEGARSRPPEVARTDEPVSVDVLTWAEREGSYVTDEKGAA